MPDTSYREEDIRRILDHSMDGLVVLDHHGIVQYVNTAAEIIFGRERSNFIGLDFGFPVSMGTSSEINVYRKAEGHRTVEVKSAEFPWRDQDSAILLSIRDITDRKELEGEILKKEQEKSYLMNNMADVVLTVNENHLVTSVNKVGLRLFQMQEAEILQTHVNRIFFEDSFNAWFESQKSRLEEESGPPPDSGQCNRFYAVKWDGSKVMMEIFIRQMKVGGRSGYIFSARDISSRLQVERQLKVMSEAIKQSVLAKLIVEAAGNVEYVNQKFLALSGYSEAEVVGKNVEEVLASLGISIDIQARPTDNAAFTAEHLASRRGDRVWVEQYLTPIRSDSGEISHFLISQEDVTQRINLKDELESQSIRDTLTGLLNKTGLERAIHSVIAEKDRKLERDHLVHINIDHFSVINDTCGHDAGNNLLINVAAKLRQLTKKNAGLARLEADTFMVLLADRTLGSVSLFTEKVLSRIRNLRFIADDKIFNPTVTISYISLAEWYEYKSVGALFETLATASRVAKNQGGERALHIRAWDQEIIRYHQETRGISLVHKALDRNLFCLFSQPILPLAGTGHDGQCYELLIRMREKDGFLPPSEFLPAVEKYKIGFKIDQWVVRHALQWLGDNRSHLRDLSHCGINISAESLTAPDFADLLAEQMRLHGIAPEKLCFEITETAAIANVDLAIGHLNRLRELGCKIALDDFGTGMSSFSYLKKLPIDYLKIDGSFIQELKNDNIDFAMVRTIQDLSRIMGIRTIAEGVEDQETLNILKLIGIDYVQGFHTGKPVFFC